MTLFNEGPLSLGEIASVVGGAAKENTMVARVFVSKLRTRLKGSGWTLTSNSGGFQRHGTYAIVMDTGAKLP